MVVLQRKIECAVHATDDPRVGSSTYNSKEECVLPGARNDIDDITGTPRVQRQYPPKILLARTVSARSFMAQRGACHCWCGSLPLTSTWVCRLPLTNGERKKNKKPSICSGLLFLGDSDRGVVVCATHVTGAADSAQHKPREREPTAAARGCSSCTRLPLLAEPTAGPDVS